MYQNSKNSWLMDDNGDVVLSGKGITLADERQTIAQRLQNKISLDYGEWFLHNQEGIKWFSSDGVFGKKIAEINLDTQIKDAIKNDRDIKDIKEFKTGFNERGTYTIKFGALTISGEELSV